MSKKINKTDAEWQAELPAEQFQVCRLKGTERAFTGKYWDNHEAGTYRCSCCGELLFDAATKFDSGTGWPSFYAPMNTDAINEDPDRSHGMSRTEVMCKSCGAHLGHVFPDGPNPTGLRYCINSASLDFEKKRLIFKMVQKFTARIVQIAQATPTIKAFELEVADPTFKYLPGQWIEIFTEIDGNNQTSGYSVTTAPGQPGKLGLAIKNSSDHPVTRWLHNLREGDTLTITRGQGPFVFLPDMGEDIVLIGGGVGITPLLSIWRYVRDASPETHATLFYSVSHPDEILFREELEQSARQHTHLGLEITVTQPCVGWAGQTGRINKHKLSALNAAPDSLFYLCGPPGMVDDMEKFLRELGVHASRIIFEKWW